MSFNLIFKNKSNLYMHMVKKIITIVVFLALVVAMVPLDSAQAAAASLSLTSSATFPANSGIIPVNVVMGTTGGNDVVVVRAIIRYNPILVSVATTDVSLVGSIFNTGNSCLFPSDYSDVALRNQPCQIITNNATYGILSITLAMPSHLATVAPGTQINAGSNLQIALVNFHVVQPVANLASAMGLQFVSSTNYADSDVISDDSLGTELLGSITAGTRSTVTSGDLNADRIVNIYDYSIMHSYWGKTCDINNPNDVDVSGNCKTGTGAVSCDIPADIDGAIDPTAGTCVIGIYDYNVLHTNWNLSL